MSDKPIILVVDDLRANIDLIRGILGDDYQVKAATSGEKALAIAAKTPGPDLILLDIMMPGMDGFQVCEELKKDPATAPIPVVFITGFADEDKRAQGLSLGAVDLLSKPVDVDYLTRVVRDVLGQQPPR